MKTLLCLCLLTCAAIGADTNQITFTNRIETIERASGRILDGVRLESADVRGLMYSVTNGLGGGLIPLTDLRAQDLERFGVPNWMFERAVEAEKAKTSKQIMDRFERVEAVRRAMLRAEDESNWYMIGGKVIQKVSAGQYMVRGEPMQGDSRKKEITFFLLHPSSEYIDDDMIPHQRAKYTGDKEYKTVLGAKATIRVFDCRP
jgi:hypothetical protein